MSAWDKVVIVGVGLLGGSVGLGLRKRELAKKIVGLDRDPDLLRQAQACGAIHASSSSLPRAAAGAELVVLCTPIDFIPEQAISTLQVNEFTGYVTDVGSTKGSIVQAMEHSAGEVADDDAGVDGEASRTSRFVGSHPLAGGERSGPQHADADLFSGCTSVLVPLRSSSPAAVAEIERFWQALGAKTRLLDADTHDEIMASVSHLPHLVASALAACTPTEALPMTATGWRDSTRIAAGDVNLWASILLDNRDKLLASLDRFDSQIALLRRSLLKQDRAALLQLLQSGKHQRDSLGS